MEENRTKRCPYCAEEIQQQAILCRYCGRALPGYEEEVPPPLRARGAGPNTRLAIFAIVATLLVVVLAGLLAWNLLAGTPLEVRLAPPATDTPVPTEEPCYVQAASFTSNLEALVQEWDDTNALASRTSRVALGPVVGELQDIRRRVREQPCPPCAEMVKTLALDYMSAVVDSYLAFMGQEPDEVVESKIEEASGILDTFAKEWARLRAGEPPYN